jgi:hypothetical protein
MLESKVLALRWSQRGRGLWPLNLTHVFRRTNDRRDLAGRVPVQEPVPYLCGPRRPRNSGTPGPHLCICVAPHRRPTGPTRLWLAATQSTPALGAPAARTTPGTAPVPVPVPESSPGCPLPRACVDAAGNARGGKDGASPARLRAVPSFTLVAVPSLVPVRTRCSRPPPSFSSSSALLYAFSHACSQLLPEHMRHAAPPRDTPAPAAGERTRRLHRRVVHRLKWLRVYSLLNVQQHLLPRRGR